MPTYHLYCGDCLEIVPQLDIAIDAVASDPPYGCKAATNNSRFSGGLAPSHDYRPIVADDVPFDPSPWLHYPKVVLFGSQFFGDKLPVGTSIVWVKKRDNQLGTFLSDGEIAWQKGGTGCYVFPHVWHGFDRESERGQKTLHPAQKPVVLWRFILEKRLKLTPGQTVLDPYCGSGSCGVAALSLGLNYVGIDIEPDYVEITRRRLEEAVA